MSIDKSKIFNLIVIPHLSHIRVLVHLFLSKKKKKKKKEH